MAGQVVAIMSDYMVLRPRSTKLMYLQQSNYAIQYLETIFVEVICCTVSVNAPGNSPKHALQVRA